MSPELQDRIRMTAIEWHIRLRDGDDADWMAFEAWLAEDPTHVEAYHWIEDTDAELEPLLPNLDFRQAANDDVEAVVSPSRGRRLWMFGGGAIAASAAAALVLTPMLRSGRYEVTTRPGENQIVTLDAGTRITLNGDTHMVFDRKDARFAELISGEALFHVRHDAARPFRLTVGDNAVEDAGTVFNVVRDGAELRVEVAEGSVVYDPGRDGTRIAAGQVLRAADGREVRVGTAEVKAVGAWQRGQLVYVGEPLSRVAADLSRALGVSIASASAIAARPFYGTLAIEGPRPEVMERLRIALRISWGRTADGWVMKPVADGGR
ncbi:MAG TPA: FecR domain-containing protein [Sphingobium sp.]